MSNEEEQAILEKARKMIQQDISETFSGIKPPVEKEEVKDKGEDKDEIKKSEEDPKDDKDKDKEEVKKGEEDNKDPKKPEDEDEVTDDKDKDKDKKPDEDEKDKKDEKGEEDKKKDEKADDKKADEDNLAQLEIQNQALMEQVEELSGQIFAGPQVKKPEDKAETKLEDKKDEKADEKADEKKLEPTQFVNQETFEEATSSPEGLNALLTAVVDTAAKEGERRGYERAIRETPALVDQLTEKAVGVREAVHDFLDVNKDLIPVRQYVGLMVNQLKAENPDWPLDKLFGEAGKVVREKLKLSKVAKEVNENKGSEDKPAFSKRGAGGGGKGRQDTSSKLTDLQKEIGELADVAV